jgi:hypothetical protein
MAIKKRKVTMTDAGEKLAKRIEHGLGFKASVNYERLLTLDEVVTVFCADLERAAAWCDKEAEEFVSAKKM